MTKRQVRKTKARRRTSRDAQLAEFEKRDLGADIRASGAAQILHKKAKPTSILLDENLVTKLRDKGARRGIGYQTMLKLIVHEHVDDY